MKKKEYQSPHIKVVRVHQTEIICVSTGRLTGDDFGWGGFDSSNEGMTGDDFNWGYSDSSTEGMTGNSFGW